MDRIERVAASRDGATGRSRTIHDPTTGTPVTAAVVERDDLAVGDRVPGPAVVVEPQTTTWLSSTQQAVLQADLFQQRQSCRPDGPALGHVLQHRTLHHAREQDVLQGRQFWDQVIELKDKADVLMPEPGALAEEKLTQPQFGNYVDHAALFGQRRSYVTPAPPRLWRLRPAIYNATMPRLGERITGLANGLNQNDGSDFKDFSAGYFLDEAAAAPLLGNAKKIAAAMTAPTSRDRPLKALVTDTPPTAEQVVAAIETAFRKIVGRAPTAEEQERFGAFHKASSNTGGHVAGAKALLTAILLQPEVLYRMELGLSLIHI